MMKKILKPAEKEDAVYFSDFSGRLFDYNECGPPCEIVFGFNYGSKFDGSELHLYLTDEEALEILNVIKQRLSEDTKEEYREAINAYDHGRKSPRFHNSIDLLRYITDERVGYDQSV